MVQYHRKQTHCSRQMTGNATSGGGLWLIGSDAVHALGQVSISPMFDFESEGSIPIWDVGFSPLISTSTSRQAVMGFLLVLLFAPPPSGTFKIQFDSNLCNS